MAAAIPLNPAYRENEFDFFFEDVDPKALVVTSATEGAATRSARKRGIDVIHLDPRFDAPAGIFTLNTSKRNFEGARHDPGCEDTALLLYTSGTTSRPKRVPLTHRNLLCSAAGIAASLELNVTDRCLDVMPLFHIHGLVGGLLSSLSAASSVAVPPAFDSNSFFVWLEDLQPTWYTAVPTMHQAILRSAAAHGGIPHSLRFIRSCSAALPPKLMTEAETMFGVPVIEAYGMTEASHQMASNSRPPGKRKAGSVGRPTGTGVAIMDESGTLIPQGAIGEIVGAGRELTTGYEGNVEANRTAFTDGWFRTGDQGYFDTDGYLFLTGRIKELINRGGMKLAPLEIEAVLLEHPAVSEAVVFPVSTVPLGEDVAAAVVLRPGHAVPETELQQFAALRLADFKIPRRIAVVEEIPKGGTGKVQRRQLSSQIDLNSAQRGLSEQGVEERTEIESQVASVWCAVLQRDRVDVHDPFFALGSESLTAVEVVSSLSQRLGLELSYLSFIETPTVSTMAAKLASLQEANSRSKGRLSSLVELQRGRTGKPIFVFPGGGGGDDEFIS